MKIAIDISPLSSGHSVRGQGFYLSYLKQSLQRYFPNHTYNFFTEKPPGAADILHYPYFDPFSKTLSLLSQTKTIVTVHDLTPLVCPKLFPIGIKGQIKWQLQKQRLQRVGRIITDSHASQKDIVRLTSIPETKIDVVHLAAGDEFRQQNLSSSQIKQLREKYRLPEKFALYVGDVTANKNLVRLVNACLEKNIPLVMVGKALVQTDYEKSHPWNKDLVEVQKIAKKHATINLLGFVSGEDLVLLYNLATVFVFPSLYEGFGLPVLEAMQSGLPVVTTHEGSLKEVAGDAAYIVDAYSKESIAKGVEQVFKNELLQKKLKDKGLTQARKFSWQKTAEETIKAYEKVSS